MNRPEQDRLLRGILGGAEAEALRRGSLEHGLATLRRRRQRRVVATCCAVVAVAGAVSLAIHQRPKSPESGAVVATDPALPEINYLTDDDLRALLADRSYALIGPPGQQQFLFLDEPGDSPH